MEPVRSGSFKTTWRKSAELLVGIQNGVLRLHAYPNRKPRLECLDHRPLPGVGPVSLRSSIGRHILRSFIRLTLTGAALPLFIIPPLIGRRLAIRPPNEAAKFVFVLSQKWR